MKTSIKSGDTISAQANSSIEVVSPDGEVIAQVQADYGLSSANKYLKLFPAGYTLHPLDGVLVIPRPSRVFIQKYGEGSHESGANPDYQPQRATPLELEMRTMMRQMQSKTDRLDARARALEQIERIPRNLPPVEPELVEPVEQEPVVKKPIKPKQPGAPLAE